MIPIAKPYLTEEEAQSASDAVLSGWVTQGPRVQEFEEKFARHVGSKYAIAVSSCTTALHLCMLIARIQPEDEVICPSMSFIATANSILYAGGIPVLSEVHPDTLNIDIDHVKRLISNRTKAILIVHQMGMPADIDAFRTLCVDHDLTLIEDAACAVGSEYKGKKIGSHSDLVCFSFHPRKVITTGDGGMITTSREDLSKKLKLLRQHGMSVSDSTRHASKKVMIEEYIDIGYNYRMTDIQASVGITQMKKLDWIISERRKIARKYNDALKNIDCVKIPEEKEGYLSNYQSYSLYLKKNAPISRNDLMQKMLDDGIATRRGIMTIHREPAYREMYPSLSLPVTEDLSDRSILLPLYVPMEEDDIDAVIGSISRQLRG